MIRTFTESGERPLFLFCGDGISDISAARETDLLLAKEGNELVDICQAENIPYYPFKVFLSFQFH